MRLELYKCQIDRADWPVTGFVLASDEQRASEILIEHEIALNREITTFKLERVDETLPADQHLGLEALLEHAPAGFASFCAGLGWIAHAVAAHSLQFYHIEEVSGDEYFIIAPTRDMAAAIYTNRVLLGEDEARLFRIYEDINALKQEALRGLPALLELGPVGVVTWDDERGWSSATD